MEKYSEFLLPFKRSSFYNEENRLTFIGSGEIGGKASGLMQINEILRTGFDKVKFNEFDVAVPNLCVIRTGVFDTFMRQNNLYKIALSNLPDDRIAHAFQKAELPFEILGDLRSLISQVHLPLAIRSSSLLEDKRERPFAGIYETKMIPNNQADIADRFGKLVEAIKFVYASTFFKAAKDYMNAIPGLSTEDEKMAVIIQEVIGLPHEEVFFPHVSGVARSYNYYSFGNNKPEDGVINLALGLGKTIVENEPTWFFAPTAPHVSPPFNGISDMLSSTQIRFWAVNMSGKVEYNPLKETEFLVNEDIYFAEKKGVLKYLVSTYDENSGSVITGSGKSGPRILTFAPLLRLGEIRLPQLLMHLLKISEDIMKNPVEIEFAMNLEENCRARFGFLQVRPMNVSHEKVKVTNEDLFSANNLCSSDLILGNGSNNKITEVIYLKSEAFNPASARQISSEIEFLNLQFIRENKNYLLIGSGRWGTTDEWAGIPVAFGQISKAAVIVEVLPKGMNSELSQGSHFFHNLMAFNVLYFSVPSSGKFLVDWDWLKKIKPAYETEHIALVKLPRPLTIKVDGESGRGIIKRN